LNLLYFCQKWHVLRITTFCVISGEIARFAYKRAVFGGVWTSRRVFPKSMQAWNIKGQKVGRYRNGSVINALHGEKNTYIYPGKTVRCFDDNVDVGGTDASNFFSVYCAISATTDMQRGEICELLADLSLLINKNAPSLVYIAVGSKVCVLSSASCVDWF